MADKEERILCNSYDGIQAQLMAHNNIGMTRQEAINRIARAICHQPYPSCKGCIAEEKKEACKQAFEGMKELAEVALDALLGVEK